MPRDPSIKIIRQTEETRFALDGTSTYFVRVEFMVNNHGPFVERIPKTEFNATARDLKLNAFAREVTQ